MKGRQLGSRSRHAQQRQWQAGIWTLTQVLMEVASGIWRLRCLLPPPPLLGISFRRFRPLLLRSIVCAISLRPWSSDLPDKISDRRRKRWQNVSCFFDQFLWFRRFPTAPIPLSLSFFPLAILFYRYYTGGCMHVCACLVAYPPVVIVIIIVVYTVAQICICAMYLTYIHRPPPNLIPHSCCACCRACHSL
jgi:hypothetical protein